MARVLTSTLGHPLGGAEGKHTLRVCSLPDLKLGSLTHPKKNKCKQTTPLAKRAKGPQCHPDQKLQAGTPQAKCSLSAGLDFWAHTLFFFFFFICCPCFKS